MCSEKWILRKRCGTFAAARTNGVCLRMLLYTTRHDDKRMYARPPAVGIGVNARAPTDSSQCESDKRTKKK